jgi:TolA-binding protein
MTLSADTQRLRARLATLRTDRERELQGIRAIEAEISQMRRSIEEYRRLMEISQQQERSRGAKVTELEWRLSRRREALRDIEAQQSGTQADLDVAERMERERRQAPARGTDTRVGVGTPVVLGRAGPFAPKGYSVEPMAPYYCAACKQSFRTSARLHEHTESYAHRSRERR